MKPLSLTYHIGDVHGCNDLLVQLVRFIESDAERRGRAPVFSFLGDLVDRGPESMLAMETVRRVLDKWEGSVLHLGNHDEWFLEALETDGEFMDAESWIVNGGYHTIASYDDVFDMDVFRRIRKAHPQHVAMLKQASLYTDTGPLIAVHAGIDPIRSLENQRRHDLNWIRDPFLEFVEPRMRPVVHGHTIVGTLPVVTENRISIDTGAYRTGRLTCLIVDPVQREMSFVQSQEGRIAAVEPKRLDRGYGTLLDRLGELFESCAETETAQ